MKLLPYVIHNLLRRPLRTGLTAGAIALAAFTCSALLSLDAGVKRMVSSSGDELTLTVFERNKPCPPFSHLPVHYREKIAGLPGVLGVMPVRFLLSNCQMTTDLVAVHGIEADRFRDFRRLDVPEDEYRAFCAEKGSALVGKAVASKYNWRVGQQVTLKELRGISFVIKGLFSAPGSSLESVILLDRLFLEQSIAQPGVATLFMVRADTAEALGRLGKQIDELFANAPTQTRSGPEREFIAGTISDFSSLVAFAQIVAYGSLALLLAAVANSLSMSVRDRLGEMAVLRTLGFRRRLIAQLVMAESAIISLVSACIGVSLVAAFLKSGCFSISVEGFTIQPHLSSGIAGVTLLASSVLGVVGAWLPAVRGANRPIVDALRGID